MRNRFQAFIGLAILLTSGAAASAEQRVDAVRRVAIFMKILTYDHNLKQRCPGGVRIGVAWKDGDAEGAKHAKEIMDILRSNRNMKVSGLRFSYFPVSIKNAADLKQTMQSNRINNMILCPGLADLMRPIAEIAARTDVLLLTSEEKHLTAGAAVGVIKRGNLPKIRINLHSATKQGVQFDARLLRIVEAVSN